MGRVLALAHCEPGKGEKLASVSASNVDRFFAPNLWTLIGSNREPKFTDQDQSWRALDFPPARQFSKKNCQFISTTRP